MKKLKQFNYFSQHGSDKGTQYYIMASSQKQVVDLFESMGKTISASYIKDYFYKAWGDNGDEIMKGIEITEPCIYAVKRSDMFGKFLEKPKKVA
jgi:hypothetical protein